MINCPSCGNLTTVLCAADWRCRDCSACCTQQPTKPLDEERRFGR